VVQQAVVRTTLEHVDAQPLSVLVQSEPQVPVEPEAWVLLPWLAVSVIGAPDAVQVTVSVKLTVNGDEPCGGVIVSDGVPLPATVQPVQVAFSAVGTVVLTPMVMLPAPASALNVKDVGVPAIATNVEGVIEPTLASACGVVRADMTMKMESATAGSSSFIAGNFIL
jgi:hypothetical protein